MLISLQYVVTWLAIRSTWFRRIIKSEPALLFYRGEFLQDQMRKERVVRDEILTAIRQQGVSDLIEVEAVVLETDGSLNVVEVTKGDSERPVLSNVRGYK